VLFLRRWEQPFFSCPFEALLFSPFLVTGFLQIFLPFFLVRRDNGFFT